MATEIRPELSEKNRYWIDRHRYYELKHFCLQYPLWKKQLASLDGIGSARLSAQPSVTGYKSDPVGRCVENREYYSLRMEMVRKASVEADFELSDYIFRAVTEGLPYHYLKLRLDIPCCKDTYYEAYRRFFWLLSAARQ